MAEYETILVEQRGAVTLVTLNRPQALNALNSQVLADLLAAFAAFDADASQGCAVLTGSEKAFAAGADIKEMSSQGFADMYGSNFGGYERLTRTRKPVIAAVAGYALGGGCELAMMCDFILAADTAKFGQPEVKLAVSPGMGGSQRLTRAVGEAKAMEMCLTGRMMDAAEAERGGLVSRTKYRRRSGRGRSEAAATIASMAPLAVMANKEMVNAAFETGLAQGVQFERRLFHGLFGTADQKEGMAAFVEKRAGQWTGKSSQSSPQRKRVSSGGGSQRSLG
ncbi:enoyl-CoA hydratase-related protein [Sphingomonas sp. MMS24-JH45]